MEHVVHVSDSTFRAVQAAAERARQSVDDLVDRWLRERADEGMDVTDRSESDEEWLAGLDRSIEEAAQGRTISFDSTEEFLAFLDTIPPRRQRP